MIGLGADGSVLFMNAAAEEAIRGADGLAVVDGRLRAARAANDRTLQQIIGRVLRSRCRRLSPTPAVRWRWRGRADARRSWCG